MGSAKGLQVTAIPSGRPRTVAKKMFIGGEFVDAISGRTFASINPFDGIPWAEVPNADHADVDRAVQSAKHAFPEWAAVSGTARSRLLRRLADIIERDADELGRMETQDNGKLLREMVGQMHALADYYHYFAGLADKIQGDVIPTQQPSYLAYTVREPVGVVAAITPWNSPLLLMAWKLAPALAAGCTFVVKPSEHTPVSTLAFAERVHEAGFPPGVFNVVTSISPDVGRALASHPDVDKVAFTGSTAVGIDVGMSAMRNLSGVVLELGGKSAQIVFADAPLDAAANGVISGIFAATGQTCMAGSRLLVEDSIHDDFVQSVVDRAEAIKLGDPAAADTEMGPVSNPAQFAKIQSFLKKASSDGGEIVCGGRSDPVLGGLFMQPTVITGTAPGMSVVDEEIFGPVLAVSRFKDEEEAIRIANGTPYGLAGAVWTENLGRAHRVAHQLRAGTVWINAYRVVGAGVPFGGVKQSGLGRENGIDAIREYTETKSIWVNLSNEPRNPFVLG
jgi:aldehyde dehydrogenase (NAD+)